MKHSLSLKFPQESAWLAVKSKPARILDFVLVGFCPLLHAGACHHRLLLFHKNNQVNQSQDSIVIAMQVSLMKMKVTMSHGSDE